MIISVQVIRSDLNRHGKGDRIAKEQVRREMVKVSKTLLNGISKSLSEILVCPLSKQPLRVCEETGSLISDAIGVAFPIKDGIPCLVPEDGKVLDPYDTVKTDSNIDSSTSNNK